MKDVKQVGGFTLIELLVVVLIIGILAAVALPQYQKSMEKAKAAEAFRVLKSVFQSFENYYLENGVAPRRFDQLAVDIPWKNRPDLKTSVSVDVKANYDWQIAINLDGSAQGVYMRRLQGEYVGGTFYMWQQYGYTSKVPTHQIICGELISKLEEGSYCVKLFQGKKLHFTSSTRYYKLPF